MLIVFIVAALIAFAASELLPYEASGLGIDAMLIFLSLALVVALFRLLKLAWR